VLVAGCDVDGERRRLFAERWNVPVYTGAAVMLREHKPEILIIATHPDSHKQYCRLAYTFSVPVVICEKPLADTLGKARKIVRLTRQGKSQGGHSGMRIITNHERRYSADYIQAKSILESKRLGALLGVRGVLYMGRGRRLLDVLWHDGTHLADAIMFLTDRTLRRRRAWGGSLNTQEGTAYLEALLENKGAMPIPCVIEVGARRDHLVFEMEFSCERGKLRIGNGVYEVWESAESPYAEGFRSLKLAGDRFQGNTGYFANMVADAVACVRDPSRQPRSGAQDGLKVIEYLNAVKRWR
jgi:predicted dehydrogenase